MLPIIVMCKILKLFGLYLFYISKAKIATVFYAKLTMLEMIITDNINSMFAISIKGTVPRNFYHFFVKLVSPISRIIGTTPSIIYKHRSPIFEEQYQSKSQS